MSKPVPTLVIYRPKKGKAAELAALVKKHEPALRKSGLVTAEPFRVWKAFDIRKAKRDPEAASLSGGNLQKFVVGREILREPGVLVVSQPTWGVDAGAAAGEYRGDRCKQQQDDPDQT